MTTDLDAALAALDEALGNFEPATTSAFDEKDYPGLKITQAPAQATDLDDVVNAAFAAAAWPKFREPIPLPGELTDDQRGLAERVAGVAGLPLHRWAIPQTLRARRRWLGLDEPGVLERPLSDLIAGETLEIPLWRALREVEHDERKALFSQLSEADQLQAFSDLVFGAYRVGAPPIGEVSADVARGWAPAFADRLVALFAPGTPHTERGNRHEPARGLREMVVGALVKAGVPIEPRWDELVPFDLDLLEHVPETRREAIIVRNLEAEFPMWAFKRGLQAARRFPSRGIVDHLLSRADRCFESLSCPPRRDYLATLRRAVSDQPELVERIGAYLDALDPLPELRCTHKVYPRSADELTEGQQKQLAVLGKDWSTDDGPIVEEDENGEARIGPIRFVSAYAIADADGNPAFEALLYMDEDGAVCRAGTLNSVVYSSQKRLSWNIDEPTVEALHAILRDWPPRRD